MAGDCFLRQPVIDFAEKFLRTRSRAPLSHCHARAVHRDALGEVLALRWSAVDLAAKTVTVREALEEPSERHPLQGAPKTKAGRRHITLPDAAVDALREHRRAALELRMQIGAGQLPDDALLFANLEGGPMRPSAVSSDRGELADSIGMPEITFHGLRHTHASQLIERGVDIVTISKRFGHA